MDAPPLDALLDQVLALMDRFRQTPQVWLISGCVICHLPDIISLAVSRPPPVRSWRNQRSLSRSPRISIIAVVELMPGGPVEPAVTLFQGPISPC